MITLYLEAPTLAELRGKAMLALGLVEPFDHAHPDKGDFGALLDNVNKANDLMPATEPQGSPPEGTKARRAHRRTKPAEASPEAPVAPQEAEPDPLEEAFGKLGGDDPEPADLDAAVAAATDPKAETALELEMVKRDVISKLADLFASGQVAILRKVLAEHGNGAKSFPEIDAAAFPAIKAALSKAVHA